MTLSEMTDRCIALLGEDYISGEAERSVLKDRLAGYLNSVYRRVVRDSCPPIITEDAVPVQGKIAVSSLQKPFLHLCSVTEGGEALHASEGYNNIYIYGAKGTVSITYCYVPEALEDTDEPVCGNRLSPDVYIFGALSLLASCEGRHTDAAAWNSRSEAAMDVPLGGVMWARRWLY